MRGQDGRQETKDEQAVSDDQPAGRNVPRRISHPSQQRTAFDRSQEETSKKGHYCHSTAEELLVPMNTGASRHGEALPGSTVRNFDAWSCVSKDNECRFGASNEPRSSKG